MNAHAHDLIATAAQDLAGKAHTVEALQDALYRLALDTTSPVRLELPCMLRRVPTANEVLPRHQRAMWARAKTVYDEERDSSC